MKEHTKNKKQQDFFLFLDFDSLSNCIVNKRQHLLYKIKRFYFIRSLRPHLTLKKILD